MVESLRRVWKTQDPEKSGAEGRAGAFGKNVELCAAEVLSSPAQPVSYAQYTLV